MERTDATPASTPLPRREPGTHWGLTNDPRANTQPPRDPATARTASPQR